MQAAIDKLYGYFIQYGLNILAAILIFVIGKWVAHISSRLVERLMLKSHVERTLVSFAKNIIYFGVLTFVVIAALNKAGVETNSFALVIVAVGLAIGLALQGSLANFAAGVMMIMFQPFQVGDTIEAGGACGKVASIQIFNTIMTSADNKKIIVPNAKITADKIVVYPK
ncbi:MAG: mechanosensitive ion channel [Candidatus Omnitrophica bacterium]|nr:mechanosensitive ion channel [Candidatus Omnitrophota bacterium]MBU1870021.1 mechanosensitive ion channel [Candidatus Omnitrophota bacterium]